MSLKYYSKLPSKMHLYVVFTLILVVIGFATLIGPFVVAYFREEKYNLEKLEQTDRELKNKHAEIWENLSFSWKKFWLNKINARLVKFSPFANTLDEWLESIEGTSSSWDNDSYLAFYEDFLKTHPIWNNSSLKGQAYYYLVDSAGQVHLADGSMKPSWQNFNDLNSLDVALYFGNDVSKMLKSRNSAGYLQYNVQLGISEDSMNSILTFLFYDFAMEDSNLRFAVSVKMGDVFERARDFFTLFEWQISHSDRSPLKTTLVTIDEGEDGAYFFKTYGRPTGLDAYNLTSGKLSENREPFLYKEMADAIIQVIKPSLNGTLADPSLNFLLSTDDRAERGKRLGLDLQMRDYMMPFIVSNIYESLDQTLAQTPNRNLAASSARKYVPRILSIGKMFMLPSSYNLVLLDSEVTRPWWDAGQFVNANYNQKLKNIIFLFIIFFVVMLVPLLSYTYLMTQYARDFFQIRKYIKGLPTTEALIEKHEGESVDDLLARVSKIDAEGILGDRVIWDIQQRFVKLVQTVDFWREQSSTDELTGLLNRKGLNQICSYEFNRMRRSGSNFSLILLDVDRFKSINDQYGHEVGDLALKSLTKSLISTFRMSDYLGRWGGEEFLIILPDTSLQGAIQVAEGARSSVEKMIIQTREASLQLTISIGVTSSSDDITFTDMLNYTDKSLYQAKQNGRNQVWVYSKEEGFFAVPVKDENSRKIVT